MEFLTTEMVSGLLSDAGKIALKDNVIMTMVILGIVSGHFRTIGKKVDKLTDALVSLETKSSERMGKFDDRLTKLEEVKYG
jgi:hypothetical protein